MLKSTQDIMDFDYAAHHLELVCINYRACFKLRIADGQLQLLWQSPLRAEDLSFDRLHAVRQVSKNKFVLVDE